MRKLVVMMFLSFVINGYAQQYINVKRTCPNCMGYGVVTSFYGSVYCSSCSGHGYVVAVVRNPNYNLYCNNINFQGASNDGTYTKTSYSVSIYTESGHPKGVYAVYLHHGKRYINFNNTWICIQGESRFGYCGNWYVIK